MPREYTYTFDEFFYDTSFHDYENQIVINVADAFCDLLTAEMAAELAAVIDRDIIRDLQLQHFDA